jgi:hypothetical protein
MVEEVIAFQAMEGINDLTCVELLTLSEQPSSLNL